jgi:hypothetical protein
MSPPSFLGVDATIVNYQARPDRPRVDAERGREVKYETVAGTSMRLDVPPRCRPMLGRRQTPLWITEGIRKGDSLASRGLCAIALLGVDCFRVKDWDRIALDERDVYVVYERGEAAPPTICCSREVAHSSRFYP